MHPPSSSLSPRLGDVEMSVPTARRRATHSRSSHLVARATSSACRRPPSLIARPILYSATISRTRSSRPGRTRAAAAASSSSPPSSASAAASTPDDPPSPSSSASSWQLLRDFSAAEFRRQGRAWVETPEKRARLRDALMTAYRLPAPAESGFGWPGAPAPGAANAPAPPEIIVGVTASDARVAVRALREWCAALGLPYVQPEARLGAGGTKANADAAATGPPPAAQSLAALPPGPVYVKYAPAGGLCYASPYTGPDRGVLLQLGQAPLLGHFPLGLHDGVAAAAGA